MATLEQKFSLCFRLVAALDPVDAIAPHAVKEVVTVKEKVRLKDIETTKDLKEEPKKGKSRQGQKFVLENFETSTNVPYPALAKSELFVDFTQIPRKYRTNVILHSEVEDLYGLLRQVVEGDCNESEPSIFDFVARAKRSSWLKRRGMSREQAMEAYISIVTDVLSRMDATVPEVDKFKKVLHGSTTTNNPIEVFVDMLSQPSRALKWTILLAKIPNIKFVEIRLPNFPKGFESINPFMKVPAMNDNGYFLSESMTIARYLINKYHVSTPLWPNRLEAQSRVSEYLDWHHGNLRHGAAGYGRLVLTASQSGGTLSVTPNSSVEKVLVKSLNEIEKVFLARGAKKFVASDDEPSLADLWCFSELKQLALVRYSLEKYPLILAYMDRIKALPHYDEVFTPLEKVIAKSSAKIALKANL